MIWLENYHYNLTLHDIVKKKLRKPTLCMITEITRGCWMLGRASLYPLRLEAPKITKPEMKCRDW
jgi:hypothetical protein